MFCSQNGVPEEGGRGGGSREAKEGWPLLTVETVKLRKLVTQRVCTYKSKASFLGWVLGLVMPVQEIFVLPWQL